MLEKLIAMIFFESYLLELFLRANSKFYFLDMAIFPLSASLRLELSIRVVIFTIEIVVDIDMFFGGSDTVTPS